MELALAKHGSDSARKPVNRSSQVGRLLDSYVYVIPV